MFARKLASSVVVGGSLVILLDLAVPEKHKISNPTQIAILASVPVIAFPLGSAFQSFMSRMNQLITPAAYWKDYRDEPFRLRNYLLNKRFMFLDICLNQLGFSFVLAYVSLIAMRHIESLAKGLYPVPSPEVAVSSAADRGKGGRTIGLKEEVSKEEVQHLAKVRWSLVVLKIAVEYYFGFQFARDTTRSLKGYQLASLFVSLLWTSSFTYKFLDLPESQLK